MLFFAKNFWRVFLILWLSVDDAAIVDIAMWRERPAVADLKLASLMLLDIDTGIYDIYNNKTTQ